MKNSRINTEIFSISHMITLITMTIFSIVLIILNRIMNWELWMIPVIVAGTAACVFVHISGRLSPRTRIYLYGGFLILESFYYAVNISTVYDSTAIVVIMAFLFSITGERGLVIAGVFGGIAGMALHLINKHISNGANAAGGTGLIFQPEYIIRVIWHFFLILLAAVIADKISSAWKNTEDKYQKRIDDILKENESANNFLANVSHEIRTPINAVLGLSAIMKKEDIPEQVRTNMYAITEAGHRIADQIENIMDYTEIDTKTLSLTRETYMINSIINDLITQLRFTRENGLDLVIDLDPAVPSELVGDGAKLKKILWHLISNGFKFTHSGGVNVNITCKKREYGVNLIFEVTDTGVGMTEDELAHVYDKFYQSDSGRSRAAGGLGLGIPIVNGFVRSMGGFLYMDSTPGQGTLVRVSIPQEVVDSSPCISVGNKENIHAAGFLSFMTTKDSRVRDFYLQMIGHLVKGLDVTFTRAKSVDELKELMASTYNVTHLFVGTGEYLNNKEYIDELTSKTNVVLVEDKDYNGTTGDNIALLKKPFCGAQAANFLNYSRIEENTEYAHITCPGVTALVVDDEPMNLLVARGIFESYGMTVSTVTSGPDAIDACSNNDFDIIFMDHMMPGMDGVETMKRLRANAAKERKELCIVALTANAASSAKEMFMSEGFDGFIPKPIELIDLERVLKHVLPKSAIAYVNDTDEKAPDAHEASAAPAEHKAPEVTRAPASPSAHAVSGDKYSTLRACGIDINTGLHYCQNEIFYDEMLEEYAKGYKDKLKEIDTYYESSDWKNYRIRVHAIKSTSKMIGALELSDTAKALEAAAKDLDIDTIRNGHPDFMVMYRTLLETIMAFTGVPPESDPDTDDGPIEFDPVSGDDGVVFEFQPGGDDA